MNTMTFDTEDELYEASAHLMACFVQTNPRAVLGLATGGTPVPLYRRVVEAYRRGHVSFKNVTTFNLDEYAGLPLDHPESYHSYMRKHLFAHIDLPPSNAHIPNGSAPDLEAECRRYDSLIENAGRIDLQLLGLGHNGHIGFNEPSATLTGGTHVVRLAESTRLANARYFDRPSEVPERAITMGIGTILKAKTILLIVRGADKAEVVKRALTGPITTDCPASLLQTHPHLIAFLDNDAARMLGNR